MDSRLVLPVNTVLCGNYRIMRVVGSGGFGITYEAEDISLGTMVAIKEYYPVDYGDRDRSMSVRPKSERHKAPFECGRSNFLEEARTLARFEHPSIVRVMRVFEANSTAYMVMRFEIGLSFEDWLANLGRAPTQRELDAVIAPLLDALAVMHTADFLHRDIAPDNIIIRADGTPVLLDFGAARRGAAEVSDSLSGVVKAGYSPHEQYTSDCRLQGPWSDLYAFGGTLYRAVTGLPPDEAPLRFDEDGMMPASQAAKGAYRRDFLAAIDACLKVRPFERPQSVAELRPMLFKAEPQRSWPTRLITSARIVASEKVSAVRRSPRPWAAGAATVVLVACAYAGLAYRPVSEAEARQNPEAGPIVSVESGEVRRREAIAAAEGEARRKAEAEAAEKRRVAALEAARRREAAAQEKREEEQRITVLDETRRAEDKRKEEERLRLATIPTGEQRAAYVKRVQDVLKHSQCHDGALTGREDDAQVGLDRLVDTAGRNGRAKPGRIVLAKASVSDFESWLRDADGLERVCAPKAAPLVQQTKPRASERIARARPAQPVREYTPRRHDSGDAGVGLVLGIGH